MKDYKGAYENLLTYTQRALYYIESLENGGISPEVAKEMNKRMAEINGESEYTAKEIFKKLEKELIEKYGLD